MGAKLGNSTTHRTLSKSTQAAVASGNDNVNNPIMNSKIIINNKLVNITNVSSGKSNKNQIEGYSILQKESANTAKSYGNYLPNGSLNVIVHQPNNQKSDNTKYGVPMTKLQIMAPLAQSKNPITLKNR